MAASGENLHMLIVQHLEHVGIAEEVTGPLKDQLTAAAGKAEGSTLYNIFVAATAKPVQTTQIAQQQQQRASLGATAAPGVTMQPVQMQQQRVSLGGNMAPGAPARGSFTGAGYNPQQAQNASQGPGNAAFVSRPLVAPEPVNRNPQADKGLMNAASQGKEQDISAQISAGAYVNMTDAAGNTPLLAAVEGKHLEAVKILLANGADVNLSRADGTSPLLLAYKINNKKILKELTSAAFSTLNRAVNSSGAPNWRPASRESANEEEMVTTTDLIQMRDETAKLMGFRETRVEEHEKPRETVSMQKPNLQKSPDFGEGVSALREGAVRLLMQDLTKVTAGMGQPAQQA